MAKKKSSSPQSSTQPRIEFKKARHDYEILETAIAGMELKGSEIKSLRQGKASLIGSYILVRDGQMTLRGMEVQTYKSSPNAWRPDPMRDRRLLMRSGEISKWEKILQQKGLTIVPLKVKWVRGMAKLEIALVRGKKLHDKRSTLKERDQDRQVDRLLKSYRS